METDKIMNISGVECYEEDGTAYLKLETVARGLGFTEIAKSGNECVRWRTVRKYLAEFGIATCCDDRLPDFIPENIFYRLAMKAKNETAERFQAFIADEVIPSIRRHGAYMTPDTIEAVIMDPDLLIRLATSLKEEREARRKAEEERNHLIFENDHNEKKVQYFDACVEKNTLTGLREAAKLFGVKEKKFVKFLIENRYLYRGRKGKLLPYAMRTDHLFEVKEVYDERTGYFGLQTFLTPRGRETLRLVVQGQKESGLWGYPSEAPRAMTEREKTQMEDFYEREARKNRKQS